MAAGVVPQILVQLEAARAGQHLLDQHLRRARVALAQQAKVDRPCLRRLQHPRQVPGAWRAGGGIGARCRPGAAAQHGGDAVGERFVDLLRRNEVNVAVDGAGGDDQMLTRNHLGAGPHHQLRIDAGHGVRVARLPHFDDPAILDADVALDDAPVVDNQRVGDHEVERAALPGTQGAAALPHPIADDLAAAKGDFVAVVGVVVLHLDDQVGVGQADAVAGGRAVEIGVGGAWNAQCHAVPP